ncbi:uncharacterized protein LOC119461788 isoform X2 [Dermacentor silvarum]|nr:uncharacterized protein LOC119461788 isoform X1 [Dermacentor silvarum]XP_049528135.1 uncharacterized protein LOC119461788 isoform X2 [Dermacentor silvarum]
MLETMFNTQTRASEMSSRGDEGLNGSLKKAGSKRSKDLLRSEIITREDHIRSLVQSKGPPKTFQVTSSALAQARSFLPKLAEAERTRLATGCDNGASIEAEDTTSEGPFIEMNFALAGLASSSESSSDSEVEESDSEAEEASPAIQVRPTRRAVRRGTATGPTLIKELPQVDSQPRADHS